MEVVPLRYRCLSPLLVCHRIVSAMIALFALAMRFASASTFARCSAGNDGAMAFSHSNIACRTVSISASKQRGHAPTMTGFVVSS
jgi:hypothetical protein